jgi:hypothetical protein
LAEGDREDESEIDSFLLAPVKFSVSEKAVANRIAVDVEVVAVIVALSSQDSSPPSTIAWSNSRANAFRSSFKLEVSSSAR